MCVCDVEFTRVPRWCAQPLGNLSAGGWLVAAPLCKPRQPADMPSGKCAARFTILRKGADGKLTPLPEDPGVEVRFIRGTATTASPAPPQQPRRHRPRRRTPRVTTMQAAAGGASV